MSDPAEYPSLELELHLRCEADAVVLEVRDSRSAANLSEWSRRWEGRGDGSDNASELDPHQWWNSFGECWQEALAVHGAAAISQLWIHATADVLVCIDDDAQVIRPALYGADPRMEPDAKWLLAQLPGGAEDWVRITGAAPSSSQMVAKCSWLHRSEAQSWSRLGKLLPLSAWLATKLTESAPLITEATARASGFWSIPDAQYSRLICQIIDSDRDLMDCLPAVAPAGQIATVGQWNGVTVNCA
jgi:sugar (pentulose or hexulose) kinase